MSEIAVLTKIINPSACQRCQKTGPKNNAFDSEPVNQARADSVSAPGAETSEAGSVSKQDKSNDKFGQIYEDAINESNTVEDSETAHNQANSSPENPAQGGDAEDSLPTETVSGIPLAVLENLAPEAVSNVVQLKAQQNSAQRGSSLQQQTAINAQGVPTPQQTTSGQLQNTVSELVQSSGETTTQPTEMSNAQNLPQSAQLVQPNAQTNQQQPQMQNQSQQVEGSPVPSDNTEGQKASQPVSSVPIPEHVEISNETARARLSQPLPRSANVSQTPSNASTQATAEDGKNTQAMKETGDFQFSGEQTFSQENPGSEIPDTHKPTDPPGQEIRNMVSVEHAAQPSENASVQATQTPSRLGPVSDTDASASTVKPIDQIAQRITAEWNGTDQSIRLTLNPAQLGTVRITFSRIENEVVGMLEVQKAETRRQIEEVLPQLVSTIQENGLPLRKVEILQWDPNQQNDKDDQPDQYDLSQQPEYAQPDTSDPSLSGQSQADPQTDAVSRSVDNSVLMEAFDDVEDDEGLNLFI